MKVTDSRGHEYEVHRECLERTYPCYMSTSRGEIVLFTNKTCGIVIGHDYDKDIYNDCFHLINRLSPKLPVGSLVDDINKENLSPVEVNVRAKIGWPKKG